MSELIDINPEYVYMTIPKEYVCVYHRILAMLADYGEDMLKDCKASCTDRNSSVIECFNMFNAAVARRHLEKAAELSPEEEPSRYKMSNLILKYVKAKINQIYRGYDNSTDFVFPVDENGELKAYVSCGETTQFQINLEDGELYQHKFGDGVQQHFKLGPEDIQADGDKPDVPDSDGLYVSLNPEFHKTAEGVKPCFNTTVYFNRQPLNLQNISISTYFDDMEALDNAVYDNLSTGQHNFKVVVNYGGQTKIKSVNLIYNETTD